MNKIIFMLLCHFLNLSADAQNFHFEFISHDTMYINSKTERDQTLGGISAIQRIDNTSSLSRLINSDRRENSDSSLQSFILIKDHFDNSEKSVVFAGNVLPQVRMAVEQFDLSNIESFRYNSSTNQIFYTYEKDSTSGLKYFSLDDIGKTTKEIFSVEVVDSTMTVNRGIEALCVDHFNNVWIAEESGNSVKCDSGYINFIKFLPDKRRQYSEKRKLVYRYPFFRCNCGIKLFDGSLGNGVSEILSLPHSNKLLVLERCFNGQQSFCKLYFVSFGKNRTLIKSPPFELNDLSGNKLFKLDNLEGMTWGTDKNGNTILLLVADDNNSTSKGEQYEQHNQIVILKLVKGKSVPKK